MNLEIFCVGEMLIYCFLLVFRIKKKVLIVVHKKYTYKNGRRYGPYVYHNKRIDGKVVTSYLGKSKKEQKKTLLYLGIFLVLLGGVFLAYFYFSSPTGRVSFDINLVYKEGEQLDGDLKFRIKEGELVPKDSQVVINYGNQSKTIGLSELVFDEVISGNYYAEDSGLSGEGEGYGVLGTKVIYPTINFKLLVFDSDGGGSSVGDSEEEESGGVEEVSEEEPADEENVEEEPEETSAEDSEAQEETSEDVEESEETAEETPAENTEEPGESGEEQSEESSSEESSSQEETDDSGITGGVISETSHIVEGSVSYGNDFSYNLEQGQSVEIVEGSVNNGEEIPESSIDLKIEGDGIVVSTDYFINERGFGEDFLGDYGLALEVDVKELGLYAVEDNLEIELVYGDTVIAVHSEKVGVIAEEISETETLGNMSSGIVLLKEIPVIRIGFNTIGVINLSEYFSGAERYSINLEDINAEFDGELLNLIPVEGFKGARNGKIIAYDEEGYAESNEFSILVSSGAVKITTSREKIVVGKPVKWTKNISLESPEEMTVEIPAGAENINVKKIQEGNLVESGAKILTGSVISGDVVIELDLKKEPKIVSWFKSLVKKLKEITGMAISEEEEGPVEVVLGQDATEYVIEYETEAPVAVEEEISNGKKVIISGPEDVEYTDVIAFTEFDKGVLVGQENLIKVYWYNYEFENVENKRVGDVGEVEEIEVTEEGNGTLEINESSVLQGSVSHDAQGVAYVRQEVPFDAYDLNGDGIVDYIEWVVQHLSSQTYEIIIEISNAKHLDADRNFISDIYPEVSVRDGNWSEVIPSEHYVRVTFERNLTSDKDITIYARTSCEDNSSVLINSVEVPCEVYEKKLRIDEIRIMLKNGGNS